MSFLLAFKAKVAKDAAEFASKPFKAEDFKEAILLDGLELFMLDILRSWILLCRHVTWLKFVKSGNHGIVEEVAIDKGYERAKEAPYDALDSTDV